MADAGRKRISAFKFPWVKRAEQERAKRIESDAKLQDVLKDWENIETSVNAVEREVRINNWTLTAKLLFTGGENNK